MSLGMRLWTHQTDPLPGARRLGMPVSRLSQLETMEKQLRQQGVWTHSFPIELSVMTVGAVDTGLERSDVTTLLRTVTGPTRLICRRKWVRHYDNFQAGHCCSGQQAISAESPLQQTAARELTLQTPSAPTDPRADDAQRH
jgi:hypothetical protein